MGIARRESRVGVGHWLMLASLLVGLLVAVPTTAEARPASPLKTRVLEDDGDIGDRPSAVTYDADSDVLLVLEPDAGRQTTVSGISPSGVREARGNVDLGIDEVTGAAFSTTNGTLVALDGTGRELVTVRVRQRGSSLTFGRQQRLPLAADVTDPRDLAFSPDGSVAYVLDGAGQLIHLYTVEPDGSLSPLSGGGAVIDLADAGVAEPTGIAVHPDTGDLYVSDAADDTIKQLSVEGELLATLAADDGSLRNPGALTVAPTGDPTDDPAALSVFAVGDTPRTDGSTQLVELSLTAAVTTAAAASVPTEPVSVVQTIETFSWTPPSPDPSGIAFIAADDRFEISDGEVNEIPALFTGDNLYVADRLNLGTVLDTHSTISFSNEPTGVAYNPVNGHYFYSDDTGTRAVYELDPGPDNQPHTSDDSVSLIPTSSFGASDPEGVAFDTVREHLIVSDGVAEEIYDIDPGPNGIFDGTGSAGDDIVTSFDTTAMGLSDPEGVEYSDGKLYVLSSKDDLIGETTIDGTLLRLLDLTPAGPINPAGLAMAPASDGSSGSNLYVVDRAVDNNADPNENDGLLFEVSFGANTPPAVDAGPDQSTTVGTPVNLDGTVTDDGLPDPPGAVTTTWTAVSGPGTVTFGDPSEVDTTADFSEAGAYVLELSADDGGTTSTDQVAVSVIGSGGEITVEHRVAATSDDAEERDSGSVSLNSSDLELVFDRGGNQTVGLRFTDVSLPKDAFIVDASVQFQVDEAHADPTSLTIRGQAADNPPTFTSAASSISTRPTTTPETEVAWTPPPWNTIGEAGPDQRTPDISGIIQEIVTRPGWASGNALVLIISGTGERVAESYNGDPAAAPLLSVQYRIQSPPTVDAGPDQIISLPTTSVNLDGTVTDDGEPDPPGAVTTLWTKVSGPGTVTFGNPAAVDTTATFSDPGTYVLELTADDSELTSADQVTVTVAAANTAPTVDAGPDQTISLPTTTATLDGTVTDDGLPNPPGAVTTLWSKVSGPGTVTFGDDTAVDTTATFSDPGTYVLELTADDTEFTSSDQVTITLDVPPNQAPTVDAGPDQTIALPTTTANLDGTVTDDGLPTPPGAVTTTWSQVSGPGTATFGDASAVDTTVTLSDPGTYVLRLTADDSEFAPFDEVSVTLSTVPNQTISNRVASGSDDAEEQASGSVSTSNRDLELVEEKSTQTVGLRFRDLQVPHGATIVNATVQFKADEAHSGPTNLTFQAQATDNAPTFDSSSNNVSSRPRTTATAAWSPAPWNTPGEAGPPQQTSDISAVIQEVVNRPGWASGNALVLIVTGSGKRTAESYNGDAAGAPLLELEYSVPGQQRPQVDAGPDATVTLPDSANLDGTVTDDGLPNPPGAVTTTWSKVSGPGTVSFADASAVDTTATFSDPGTYVLRLSADDGELSSNDTMTVTAVAAGSNFVESRVSASTDDAEEDTSGNVGLSSSDLELVEEATVQTVGMRFTGLTIPPGATIVDAKVQFQADETDAVATTLTFEAQAHDNAPAFANLPGNVSGRTRTNAQATWSPAAWNSKGEAGPAQLSSDLSAVIQEVVDRPGWASGNALVLIVTGSGKRVAEAYDGEAPAAPLLQVTYTTS